MILRKCSTGLCFLLMMLSFHQPCSAGTAEEIAALLHFIERSDCIFVRNGKEYDSLTARQHIENKYNYYREKITSAEEFIQYSAAKSSMTGTPYQVLCNGVRMNSSGWLNAELEKMRTQ